MMAKRKRLAVVGGGWAGLACAAKLANHPGLEITLFEAAPELGGRARGLLWKPVQTQHSATDDGQPQPQWIDNGQHLLIGAYTSTFALLRQVGAPPWLREPLAWSGITTSRTVAQHWKVPCQAWPWRVLRGALPGQGPKGWPPSWKLSIAQSLWRLHRDQWQTHASLTAAEWLTTQDVPKGLVEHFWRPLVEGALNTELNKASAKVMARVMRDSMGGGSSATQVLQPAKNLSVDGVEPIARWLADQRVKLLTSQRVDELIPAGPSTASWHLRCRAADRLVLDSQDHAFDQVVLALPFKSSLKLWNASKLPSCKASQRWEKLERRAITTVWVALGSMASELSRTLPSWFVLNPVDGIPQIAQVGVMRTGVLALVISAQVQPASADELQASLELQILHQLNLDLSRLPQKWITEKTATWACTPETPWPDGDEVRGVTGQAGLWRCADDLEPGYPATIESAVRSGERTAESIRSSLSLSLID
jgi:predicted NAD/FAD-binding protein